MKAPETRHMTVAEWAVCVGFVLFLGTAFLQKRHIVPTGTINLTGRFTESVAISVYASDGAFLLLLLSLTFARGWHLGAPRSVVISSLGLVTWTLVRGALAADPILGMYHALRILQGIMLLVSVVAAFKMPRIWRPIPWIFVVISSLEAILGIAQVIQGESVGLFALGESHVSLAQPGVAKVDLPYDGGKILRAYGTLPHPNVLGGLLVGGIISTIFLSRISSRGFFLPALLALQGTGLLLTFSRSAILSLLTFIIFYYIIYLRRSIEDTSLKRIFVGTLILILPVAFAVRWALVSRVVPPGSDAFIRDRFTTIRIALPILREHVVAGVGPGHYIRTLVSDIPPESGTLQPWLYEYPHAVPMVLALELGLVGIVVVAVFLWTLFRAAPVWRIWLLAVVTLAPLLFLDHYLWTLQPGRVLLWGALGVVFALARETFTSRAEGQRQ